MNEDELSEQTKLVERFAVAIAGTPAPDEAVQQLRLKGSDIVTARATVAHAVFDFAQHFATEAMKRRKQDDTKRLAEGAEALQDDEYDGGSEWEQQAGNG
jgi:hypothetical protein